MKNAKIVCGIDVGTTKVCAVVCDVSSDAPIAVLGGAKMETNIGQDNRTVYMGSIENPERVSLSIRQVVSEAIENAGGQAPDEYYINIASGNLQTIKVEAELPRDVTTRGETVQKEDCEQLTNIVKNKRFDNTAIHVLPQEYSVDNKPPKIDIVGTMGSVLRGSFTVVMANKEAHAALVKAIDRLDFEISRDNIYHSGLAASMALLKPEEKKNGIALVDIGHGKTDVIVFLDGLVRHVETIPIGGMHISKDIAAACKVNETHAESIKRMHGTCRHEEIKPNSVLLIPKTRQEDFTEVPLKNAIIAIQARVEEIAVAVAAVIEEAGFASKLKDGICLTGETTKIARITEVFEEVIPGIVIVCRPGENFDNNNPEITQNTAYSTALGLVCLSHKPLDFRLVPSTSSALKSEKVPKVKKPFWGKIVDFVTGDDKF